VIRIGPLEDSGLVARQIGRQQLVILASPAYLRRHGRPTSPRDLAAHDCLVFRLPATGRIRPFELRGGAPLAEPLRGARMVLDDGEALVAAAATGLGIVQVPSYMAAEELRTGRLVEILPRSRPGPMPISLVYPAGRGTTPRLRAAIDALARAVATT
jgi:DNA-binding transcriptional LysR family regulator